MRTDQADCASGEPANVNGGQGIDFLGWGILDFAARNAIAASQNIADFIFFYPLRRLIPARSGAFIVRTVLSALRRRRETFAMAGQDAAACAGAS